jgi:exopolysaccharide biosynthesis polyprenyl glycosylphosphotransferase
MNLMTETAPPNVPISTVANDALSGEPLPDAVKNSGPDSGDNSGQAASAWRKVLGGLLLAIDLLMVVLAFALGYFARRELPILSAPVDPPGLSFYLPILIIHSVTLLVIFFFARLYHQKRAVSRIDLVYVVAASVSIAVVMTNGLTTIFLKGTDIGSDFPRQMILYVWLFTVIFVTLGRELHRLLVVISRRLGLSRDRVIIVGSGPVARSVASHITNNAYLGYKIIGTVNGSTERLLPNLPMLGTPEDMPRLIDTYHIDEVIIAMPDSERADLALLVALCQRGRVSIKIYPDLFAFVAGSMSVDELGGMPLLTVRDVAMRGWKLTLKRALDVVGSLAGLVLLSPFMLLTALLIWRESPGPIFFSQQRMGLDGRPFPMLKFRSMRRDAEKFSSWTVENDPRVTRIGRWMRRSNWDEIPNLINVLLGHMSLVGPRPEQVQYVQKFQQHIPRYMERHREKAGMTGWAQVNGLRGDTSVEERIKLDLWYVEHWSLGLDVKILIRTVVQTLLGQSRNAY